MKKFSVSEANDFKACPRLYFYKHIQGWELLKKPSWLTKGSAYDKMLENWDLGGFEKAKESIPDLFPNQYEAVDAEYVLRMYHEMFKEQPLRPVTFNNQAGNQLGFGLEFNGNDNTGPCEVRVTGYMDKLSSHEGELEVVERKTTSESIEPGSAYWERWAMDPQTKCYVWYLRQMGAKAGWVTVEVIRKPSTTINKVFDKKCPIEEYRAQVMAYTPIKTLIARHRFFVSDEQSDEFIVDHVNTLKDINNCKERQKEVEERLLDGQYAWVKNQGSCGNYGGCSHRAICLGSCTHETSGLFTKSEKWIKANGA